jgi:hypothetical protein
MAKRRQGVDDPVAARVPSSTLAQTFHTHDPSKFAFHLPPTHTIPLALLHPIFAEFVGNVQRLRPTPEDNALVHDLREAMSQESDEEAVQCEKFRQILSTHYKIQLYPADVAGTSRKTDGRLMSESGSFMIAVCEGKTWNGSGCPEVQSGRHWLESIRKTVQGGDSLDLLPCIIIYFVGAYLLPTLYPCLLS